MAPVSSPSILIGIDEHDHNYHLLDMHSNKIFVTHDATFQPTIFPARKASNDLYPNWDLVEDSQPSDGEEDEETPEDHQQRNPHQSDEEESPFVIPGDPDEMNHQQEDFQPSPEVEPSDQPSQIEDMNEEDEDDFDQEIIIDITPPSEPLRRSTRERNAPQRFTPGSHSIKLKVTEPGSYKKAMSSPYAKEWREACKREIENIEKNGSLGYS